MQSSDEVKKDEEKKPRFNRMSAELLILAALFLGLIVGVQALQGANNRPQYNPLGAIWLPR